LAVAGVPESAPVAALKEAQAGLFCTLNDRASPSVSLAFGVNVYAVPTVAEVDGVPEMVGAVLDEAETVMENAASDDLATPSLTLITILEKVPTLAVVGVPESLPLVVLKDAHAGLPEIENFSV